MTIKRHFKEFIQTNRWFKWVPNFLTICNSLCGFFAILYTLHAYEVSVTDGDDQVMRVFVTSAIVIFCAMVFDAADGFAARIFNAASMHGIQMDSLSDMVTFGVAPATLVAVMTDALQHWSLSCGQKVIVYLLCCVYLGCAALRLATYNVHAMIEKKSSEKFSGLPSPGGAAALCVTVFFFHNAPFDLQKAAFFVPVYAAILGLLMVSKIPYTHMGKWITSVHRNKKRLFVLIVCLTFVLAFRTNALMILVTGYIFSGPVMLVVRKISGKEA